MKPLKNYIREHLKWDYEFPNSQDYSFESFLRANGFTEDTVTEDAMDWYADVVWDKDSSYYISPFIFKEHFKQPFHTINEMLNSVNIDRLIKELNLELETGVKIDSDGGFDDKKNTAKQLLVYYDKFDLEKIQSVCKRMFWVLTSVLQNVEGEMKFRSPKELKSNSLWKYRNKYAVFCVEPIKSEIRTDYIREKCAHKVYHICTKKTLPYILKTGLRPKGEKNGYRFIDNKVFCFCGTGENIKSTFNKVGISIGAIDKITKEFKSDQYTVLEINFEDYNIDFYTDTFYKDRNIIFTYAYFPPKDLKEISYTKFI